jgi:hypothetical protein
MTMIVKAKNKGELKRLLDQGTYITDPRPTRDEMLPSQSCPVGFHDVVCMDPDTRMRFARIERTETGWRVQ